MNSYLDRISHFKGTPYEVGVTAGRKLGCRLEQIIELYITGVAKSKDLEKLRTGALPWLYSLPKRFQDEFEGMAEGANRHIEPLPTSGKPDAKIVHFGDTSHLARRPNPNSCR